MPYRGASSPCSSSSAWTTISSAFHCLASCVARSKARSDRSLRSVASSSFLGRPAVSLPAIECGTPFLRVVHSDTYVTPHSISTSMALSSASVGDGLRAMTRPARLSCRRSGLNELYRTLLNELERPLLSGSLRMLLHYSATSSWRNKAEAASATFTPWQPQIVFISREQRPVTTHLSHRLS